MSTSKTNKEKRISIVIGIVVGLVASYFVMQYVFSQQSFDQKITQDVNELNSTCPVMIDRETRLDSISILPNNVLQYNYTLVNLISDSVNIDDFKNYVYPMVLKNIRTNSDMKVYRDNKTTFAYKYQDKGGSFITKLSIASDQYLEK